VNVRCGGLPSHGGAESEEGDLLLFEIAHQPTAFHAVWVHCDIDAATVIEAHRTVERGLAAGADGEFAIKLLFELEHDALEVLGGETILALEAGDACDDAIGDGGLSGLNLGHLFFGADHGGDFVQAAGAVFHGGDDPAGAVNLLFQRNKGRAGRDALGNKRRLRGETGTMAFQPPGSRSDSIGGLLFRQVFDSDARVEHFGEEHVVLGLAVELFGLFELPAGGGAGRGEFPHLVQILARLTHGGGFARQKGAGRQQPDTRTASEPHYTLKCSTTKDQEQYLQARTPRKQTKRVTAPPTAETVAEVLDVTADDLNPTWETAYHAAQEKQAIDIRVLDLRGITTMADVFFICHGRNPRQNQAICDEIEKRLKEEHGERPLAVEGTTHAEWILMDYGDLVIHIFSEQARGYYDLERLYRDAKTLTPPEAE
jgi:ribosome-associated protein